MNGIIIVVLFSCAWERCYMHAVMCAIRLHRWAVSCTCTVASSVPDIHVYVSVYIEAEVCDF